LRTICADALYEDPHKEEDLLLEKELESSSKDINILLYKRLTKAKKEDLARKI
jgi:hypothetical protein